MIKNENPTLPPAEKKLLTIGEIIMRRPQAILRILNRMFMVAIFLCVMFTCRDELNFFWNCNYLL